MTLSNTEKENFIPRSNFLGYTEIEIVQIKIRITNYRKSQNCQLEVCS